MTVANVGRGGKEGALSLRLRGHLCRCHITVRITASPCDVQRFLQMAVRLCLCKGAPEVPLLCSDDVQANGSVHYLSSVSHSEIQSLVT